MKSNEFLDEIVNRAVYADYAKDAHETWRELKSGQGWTYGPRDDAKKTNPLLVPFEELAADVKGQNSLTPYAVANYFRTVHGGDDLVALDTKLNSLATGQDQVLVDTVGEYVHSHFVAAQLAKGATIASRKDMVTYEKLTPEQKSWDIDTSKKVAAYLRTKLEEYRK